LRWLHESAPMKLMADRCGPYCFHAVIFPLFSLNSLLRLVHDVTKPYRIGCFVAYGIHFFTSYVRNKRNGGNTLNQP